MQDDELNQARSILQDSWPKPLQRSPLVDGRLVAMMPLKLGAEFVKAIDTEFNTASDELSKLGEALETREKPGLQATG